MCSQQRLISGVEADWLGKVQLGVVNLGNGSGTVVSR